MITIRYAPQYFPVAAGVCALAALLLLPPGLRAADAERIALAASPPAQASQPVTWGDLGAKATAQYSGDGLAVAAAKNGAVRLRCAFQRLDGEVTSEGLWLTSTVPGAVASCFRVVADYAGRDGGAMVTLPERGVAGCEPGRARYARHGLVEEYSVSVDGVRQDFVVTESPYGAGNLRVELALNGARAEAAADGARLVLNGSGRKLAYSRLHVVDARQRELAARFEVTADHRLAVVVADAAAVYPVRIDPTFSDANWVSLGGLPGMDYPVYALAVSGTDLYAGGDFTIAGEVSANYVAKWDGSAWLALGSGMDYPVYALAVSGTTLYAGGDFTTAGGVSANYVAKWDGSTWSALGSGVDYPVYALAVSGMDLYAGGDFNYATNAGPTAVSANYIAKWDGSTWSALGSGMDYPVWALAVSGTDLYAGGDFTYATNTGPTAVSANYIAKWDGSTWSALGSGMDYPVWALAVSGTDLYAGGDFTTAGGVSANYVAKWDGSTWSALGSGMDYPVWALAVSGTILYAGGDFTYTTNAGPTAVSANYIAKWDGNAWSALGLGMDFPVWALAVSGTDLYAGGDFTYATNTGPTAVSANFMAKWDGNAWSALGSGMDYPVYALAVSGTTLYAGGWFSTAGGVSANYVAKWDGSAWSSLGAGLDYPVYALAVSGTTLYAGGWFSTAGGISASNVAKWDGSAWSSLGAGLDYPVWALAVSGTNLYAGGNFTMAGGVSANFIAKWDGSAWSALGLGMDYPVYALAVSGTNLYAGGDFTNATNAGPTAVSANYIAKWDGSTWSALGLGMDYPVYALAMSGTNLYAGGDFTYATNAGPTAVSANFIAKWDGSAWSALGLGMDYPVWALAVSGTDLYAGGEFTYATNTGPTAVSANFIAKWDGSSWSALGSGMDYPVWALAVSGTDLYAGGDFTTAGEKVSAFAAKALLRVAATNATYMRAPGLSMKIRISDIAWEGNGNPVTVQSLGASTQGATLSYNNTYIFYLPANNINDNFIYTVSNGSETATGTITVNVMTSSGGIAKTITVSDGTATIKFFGIPGVQYDVQRTTSLTEPVTWTTLTGSPLTPGADGLFSYTDASAPNGTAYYRSAQP